MPVMCQRFSDLFLFGWCGSILQFRQNSWVLTCSYDIALSLPSYTGSALKRQRELNFCNGYSSLLYFGQQATLQCQCRLSRRHLWLCLKCVKLEQNISTIYMCIKMLLRKNIQSIMGYMIQVFLGRSIS